ncbi:MAG: ATP synthase F0 subunit B [Myxococcales bacterium]|nr:ATP synthase F0 subunit B [Myxococcales bacterium]
MLLSATAWAQAGPAQQRLDPPVPTAPPPLVPAPPMAGGTLSPAEQPPAPPVPPAGPAAVSAPAEPSPAASDPAITPLAQEARHPGHEQTHHGSVIENWWSWDYGPGKSHRHPPFGFAILNFLIYLYVLKRLAWGSFRAFMANRHHSVRRALEEAAALRSKAEAQLQRYQERLRGLEAELEAITEGVRKEAEAERARIVAAAQAQAAAIQKEAEAQVQAEIERARAELHRQVALAAVAAAEALVRGQMQDADHKRLVEEYVAHLEGLAGLTPRTVPTVPPRGGRS